MTASPVVGHQIGEAVRHAVPGWLIPVFIVITDLGNPAVFLGVFVLDYWFGDRRRGSHALALALAGMATVTALKTFFHLPRPPASVNVVPASGYSFPSGHATESTIGYGILAYDLKVGSQRARFALAGLMVALVALSRVVLGVHYLRDVVAGVALGSVFLVAAFRATGHDPRPGYVIALALSGIAFVVSGASHDGVATLAGSIGAALTWERVRGLAEIDVRANRPVLLAVLPLVAALAYIGSELSIPLAAVFVVNAVVMAAAVAAPAIASRAG